MNQAKDFRNFMFVYFPTVLLDIDEKELPITDDELKISFRILMGKKINNYKSNIKHLSPEFQSHLTCAVALIIRAIKNRIKEKNPFTSITKAKQIKKILLKIKDIKERRRISMVSFDEIRFTGSEIEILFGKKFEHLQIDNTHLFLFLNTGFNKVDGYSLSYIKEVYSTYIDIGLRKLNIKIRSSIIREILQRGGIDLKGASAATINSLIKRGKAKIGIK